MSPTIKFIKSPSGERLQGERLQKVLARAGIGSRRSCEELISAGRVIVNGTVAVLGQRIDPGTDVVSVDGSQITIRPDAVYYLLNKPRGIISTASDPQGRKTVCDIVPVEPRVFPVGRLDADTEGLIILTNDGDLTFRITHPSFGLPKEYLVETTGDPTPQSLRDLRKGVELDDGLTSPARVSKLSPNVVKITIHEGRNRQVRRMFESVGFPVSRLVRTKLGPIRDTKLAPGEWRALTPAEIRSVEKAVAANQNSAALTVNESRSPTEESKHEVKGVESKKRTSKVEKPIHYSG